MARRKLTFEEVATEPVSGSALLSTEYGFTWGVGFAAADTTHPNYDDITPGSGTQVAWTNQYTAGFASETGQAFKLRSLKHMDIGEIETGQAVFVRGFRDGALVAQDTIFLGGEGVPLKHRFNAGFKDVDQVAFSFGTPVTQFLDVAFDDILVRLPQGWPEDASPLG